MTQSQMEAAADRARTRGIPCTLHQVTVESFRRGVRAGVTSLVHLPSDRALDEADVAACVGAGCIVEPTLSVAYHLCWPGFGHEARDVPALRALGKYRLSTFEALANEYWLRPLARSVASGLRRAHRRKTRLFGIFDGGRAFRYRRGIVSHGTSNLRRLFDAGATIACSNDAGAVPVTPAMVSLELGLLDRFLAAEPGRRRFRPADALASATIHGAAAMGLEGEAGSLAPGKRADIVVVEGDPFTDVGVIGSKAAYVFRGGELVVDRVGFGPALRRSEEP